MPLFARSQIPDRNIQDLDREVVVIAVSLWPSFFVDRDDGEVTDERKDLTPSLRIGSGESESYALRYARREEKRTPLPKAADPGNLV